MDLARPLKVLYALAVSLLASLVAVWLCLLADTYAHRRLDQYGAMNRWGYRGTVLPCKGCDLDMDGPEYRVLVLGGSTAYGYGVHWWESWPAQLEDQLRGPHDPDGYPTVGRRNITIINGAYNGEGAYALLPTLEDLAWLEPDAVILESGYNDIAIRNNTQLARHDSAVYRWTGYYPVLPLAIHEKLLMLRSGGYLDAAYRDKAVVFHPPARDRVAMAGLSVADALFEKVEALTARHAEPPNARMRHVEWYVANVLRAVAWCDAHHLPVIVIGQPTYNAEHAAQQVALRAALAPTVRYVDNSHLLDLRSESLDGMHLSPAGNAKVAAAILPTVLDVWASR